MRVQITQVLAEPTFPRRRGETERSERGLATLSQARHHRGMSSGKAIGSRTVGLLLLSIFVVVPWGRFKDKPRTGSELIRARASSLSVSPLVDADGFAERELLSALVAVPLAGLALLGAPFDHPELGGILDERDEGGSTSRSSC